MDRDHAHQRDDNNNIRRNTQTALYLFPIKPPAFPNPSIIPLFRPPITALEDSGNGSVVLSLYHALSSRDVLVVHKLLAPDLEWWFHGPPSHQFMMRLLTGTDNEITDSFEFVPLSIDAFGSTVIVEGCDQRRDISWIHAWTVNSHGIITQVREYFNTSLTVTRFLNSTKPVSVTSLHCPSVWESSLANRVGKSVPGLVLAI
ncbi:unnamed protein product [Lactuca saligna]|uniref:Wound-induced protein 1 n=2 Tax=Lactuca TaxID=4235 RepID=A0AA35ZNB2_LACSI|nr:unnamed protein product [Lactuca saligna]